MKEQEFDRVVKDSLVTMNIPIPEDAWEYFLAKSEWQNSSLASLFDEKIQDGLSSIEPKVGSSSWATFTQYQAISQTKAEEAFDESIKRKLTGDIPITIPDTKILNEIIFRFNLLSHKLLAYKCLEAFVLAIFCLLLIKHQPQEPVATKQNIPIAVIRENEKIPEKHIANAGLSNQPENTQKSTIITGSYSNIQNNNISDSETNNLYTFIGHPGNIQPEKVSAITSLNGYSDNDAIERSGSTYSKSLSSPEGIPLRIVTPNSITQSTPAYVSVPIMPLQKNISKDRSFWLDIKASWIFDKMWAPGYISNARTIITNHFQSKSIGIDAEMAINQFFVAGGINYSYKNYNTGNKVHNEGHFINIPITVKKEFAKTDRLIPYFKAGPDLTLAATTTYEAITPESQPPKEALAPLHVPDRLVNEGVLRGNFHKNSYLGLHLALGLEVLVSHSGKIFLEASQQINPFEKGIGDNNQRFSNTTVSIGYKKNLLENRM